MLRRRLEGTGARVFTITITILISLLRAGALAAAPHFTVGTFNLENYTHGSSPSRPAKSEASRNKVRESIRALEADVLGLQEIGDTNALQELRASLKRGGMDYPYWEHVSGYDTNICVGVLSRFPVVARRPHTNDGFLLYGRRFRLTRGIAEVDVQVTPKYSFTLLVAHLKSRRPSAQADHAEIREQEAIVLREKIDTRLRSSPNVNLIVVGDLNDLHDSPAVRTVIGKGKTALVDTRPAERNEDGLDTSSSRRQITWTHFYAQQDVFSRVDYILVSRGMAREWDPVGTQVLALPNWGLASDHRPLRARFLAQDK